MTLKDKLDKLYDFEKVIEIDVIKTKYTVTMNGEIYSLDYMHTKKKKKLKSRYDKDGYEIVTIYVDSKRKDFKVHRLVAMAFIPNPKNKPEVNHKDSNPMNNNVNNLEWATNLENIRWSWSNGNKISLYDVNSPYHKYQVKMIKHVCKMLEENRCTYKEISFNTGVPIPTIIAIRHGKQWTTISKKYKISNYTKNASKAITSEIAESICKDISENKMSLAEISRRYNVRLSIIQKIFHRQTWKDVSKDYDFSKFDKGRVNQNIPS